MSTETKGFFTFTDIFSSPYSISYALSHLSHPVAECVGNGLKGISSGTVPALAKV